ncbi:MAG: hypothetical protein EOP09_10320, partial [Proteobacteria bacterium]
MDFVSFGNFWGIGWLRKTFTISLLVICAWSSIPVASGSLLGISREQLEHYRTRVEQEGDTVSAVDVKEILYAINDNLNDPLIVAARKKSVSLHELLVIYEISLPHLNLKFKFDVPHYPY